MNLTAERLEPGELSPTGDTTTRTYTTGGSLFIALLLAAVAVATWNLRSTTLTDARRSIQQLGVALAEQTDRSIQSVDLVLQDLTVQLTALPGSGEPFAQAARTQAVYALLQQRLKSVPQVEALSIVDAGGTVVNFTRRYPPPPINVADRDYFMALQPGPATGGYIAAPVRNRGNNEWTIYVARRLASPQGEFLGVVLAAIPLQYIEGFFQAVLTKPGSRAALMRQDGVLLAAFPQEEALIGAVPPEFALWQQAPQGAGIRQARGGDGADRLVSLHRLPDRPLILAVSVSTEAALASWRRQAALVAMFSLLAAGCMGLMLRKIAVQFAAQQADRLSLARRNAQLEETQLRLERQAAALHATAEALRGNEQLLAQRSATLNTTLENIDQGLLMVDEQGLVAAYNQRLLDLLGLPEELLARRPAFREILQYEMDSGELAGVGKALQELIRAGETADARQTYERTRPNGRTIEVTSVPLPGGGLVRTYSDITDRRIADARIRYTAHHDDLTGLHNRAAVQEKLGQVIGRADGVALLYMDLDRFRLINDARGHEMGDRLLLEVARRLKSIVRDTDLVARMGGDEFAIVQSNVQQPESAAALAERLRNRMAEPFVVNGLRLTVGMSMGIAVYPEAGITPDALRRSADMAMYRAKDAGWNGWRMYEPGMAAAQQDLFQLEQALREALGSNAFQLAYQPIASLESNAVVGYEALLRWTHPTRGVVPPQEFVAVAEATGLIVPLGRWVLETACREAASWGNSCRVAVNLSPVQFRQGDVLRSVQECLAQSGLPPERLELEVTEGVLLDNTDTVRETMLALHRAGVGITLDDFGTGHASLAYLRRFPFDKIKIDKSFIGNLGHDLDSDAIVEAMLLLCRRLQLNVVAEGVEDELQLEWLREHHCPLVQGFLIGRPMAAELARAL